MAPFVGRIRSASLVLMCLGWGSPLLAQDRPASRYAPGRTDPMSDTIPDLPPALPVPEMAMPVPKADAGLQPKLSGEHNMARAGNPRSTGRFAKPSQRGVYAQGYVGGSLAFRGDPPLPEEGVWGWDYTLFARYQNRIFLGWSHGRPGEREEGRYLNTNPFHVPNIFEFKIIKLPEGGAKE